MLFHSRCLRISCSALLSFFEFFFFQPQPPFPSSARRRLSRSLVVSPRGDRVPEPVQPRRALASRKAVHVVARDEQLAHRARLLEQPINDVFTGLAALFHEDDVPRILEHFEGTGAQARVDVFRIFVRVCISIPI